MARVDSVALPVSRFNVSLPLLVLLFAFAVVLRWGPTLLLDPDTYWHIAVGRWILAHRAVPHVGIFSETMPNAPWVAHEWLAETIFALLYNASSWNGLIFATALAFASALGILTRALLRCLEPLHALAGAGAAWLLISRHLLTRPHILALPILVLWFAVLVEARDEDRGPPLWLVPLMTLWANLHGGYMFGLVFAAIFAGEALIAARTTSGRLRVIRQWGLFGILATASCMITPFGPDTLWLPFHVMGMKFSLGALQEWQSPNFQHFQPLEVWLMGALALALCFGVRLPPTRVAMLLLLLHLSLSYGRDAELLGIVAPLLVARQVGTLLRTHASHRTSALDPIFLELSGSASRLGRAVVAAVVVLVGGIYLSHPVVRPPDSNTPAAALEAARDHHLTNGRVMNQYGFGGYLIFSGIHPFIDGRAELYGDPFMKRYHQAIWGVTDGLPKLLQEYRITWTIFAAHGTAAVLMEHLPGWQRIYRDDVAVVYARTTTKR